VRHPAIAEGIGYFHVPITYSAQCHMWEMRWARDPAEARGSLQNFLDAQQPDGGFHGRLYTHHLDRTDFYHANWGDAVLAVDAAAPDPGFLERAYEGLSRYARWLDATRDRERSGLYDVIDQYETGQEYMSRYQAVDPDADRYGWENRIRLKGVDVTVYTHQLKRALAVMADRLDRGRQADAWRSEAARIADGLLGRMWDEAAGLFSDVDPRSMRRTGVKAAVCFYPLLTDLLDESQVRRLVAHLDDPAEFATPFPVPSSSLDDPLFDPDAQWKGKRHNCPWNGRVWPMTNSHVIEGLLRQWRAGRRLVGPTAARILTRTVRMMFHDGDPARPNCYEHYHPVTGRASVYRGIDDYQHSWILDLLIRGTAGLDVDERGLTVDPLPMEVDWVTLDDLVLRGRRVAVERRGPVVTLQVDGRAHPGKAGTALAVPW
jgi:glycogen debranching enzyme